MVIDMNWEFVFVDANVHVRLNVVVVSTMKREQNILLSLTRMSCCALQLGKFTALGTSMILSAITPM